MCGDAPDGRSRWTLRLLGQAMVELGHVESISHESTRQALIPTKGALEKWAKTLAE